MSAPMREAPMSGSEPVTEFRARTTVIGSPAGGTTRISRSTDVVELTLVAGRVVSSVRRWDRQAVDLDDAADQALRIALDRLDEVAGRAVAVQSVLVSAEGGWGAAATPAPVVRVLARVETVAGPLVLGGRGPRATDEVSRMVAAANGLRGLPAEQPGTRRCPVVLFPAVSAVLVVAARMVLASPAAARLAGRRVLPPLTLTDDPVALAGQDDNARAVGPVELVVDGRVRAPARDPDTGALLGRAAWSHDLRRLTGAGPHRVRLSGLRETPVPADRIDVLYPVEGLERYLPGGFVRVTCVARAGAGPRWCLVRLCARPLSLLRLVQGAHGPSTPLYSDHETYVPALVLPSLVRLEGSSGVSVELA